LFSSSIDISILFQNGRRRRRRRARKKTNKTLFHPLFLDVSWLSNRTEEKKKEKKETVKAQLFC
jgi:hypothetical protein